MVNLIKIDHFYSKNHEITAKFIKTTISVKTMIRILAILQFKFEELVDETIPMDERHIIQLLEQFFELKDVNV